MAVSWFAVTLLGQWLFCLYVVAYYGGFIWDGGIRGLADSHLPKAHVPGDPVGNLAVAAHLLLAAIILGVGPLQLVPAIRRRMPAFHRWNGRAYLCVACIASISGLYMAWIRGGVGDFWMHAGISLNAAFIVLFAIATLYFARMRQVRVHRRWALRLFMAASGVWFARVGLWLWVFLTDGAGIDFQSFTGPFLVFLNFAQFLVPLAVLEVYFRALDRGDAAARLTVGLMLLVLTLLMSLGIQQAFVRTWMPRL